MQALLLETALEPVGTFSSSNELFNQIHKTNLWTLRSLNAGGYTVDCPHRERWGYGDGQVGIESLIMNRNAATFYAKWAEDWLETQNPETGDIAYTAPRFSGSGGGPGCERLHRCQSYRIHTIMLASTKQTTPISIFSC